MKSVKCYYCGQFFDRDKEEWFKPISNRYAHKQCPSNNQEVIKEKNTIDHFYQYARKVLGNEFNFVRIRNQIEEYLQEPFNYTYEGMELTLKYWYEIKKKSIDKAKGAVGIIPYIYNDAKKYFIDVYTAQEHNKEKNIKEYTKIKKITIQIPERQVKPPRLFDI